MKDRKLIWDDCPQCAYKHLAAAYAALTSMTGMREEMNLCVRADKVFYARAVILKREAETGYPGNLAAAIGCLAMAELTDGWGHGDAYRALRLTWSGETASVGCFCPCVSPAEFVAGHLAEAARELPGLREFGWLNELLEGGSMVTDNVLGLESDLKGAIRWVEETYCVGAERPRAETKKEEAR